MHQLDPNRLPRHVAIIMDGNGRWAKQRFRKRVFGHEEGADSVREVVRSCLELGIPFLTLYAFSKENWKRPPAEVKALWELLKRFLHAELPTLAEKEIRLIHVGDVEGIPGDVMGELNKAVDITRPFRKLTVTLAINYGGRQEIAKAAMRFAADVERGDADVSSLTPELFSRYLFTRHLPELDFLIRTGGELRISNFLLWQMAYTEIYFTKVLWPDFRQPQFTEALLDYQRRERRFGMTGDQVREELHEEQVADALS